MLQRSQVLINPLLPLPTTSFFLFTRSSTRASCHGRDAALVRAHGRVSTGKAQAVGRLVEVVGRHVALRGAPGAHIGVGELRLVEVVGRRVAVERPAGPISASLSSRRTATTTPGPLAPAAAGAPLFEAITLRTVKKIMPPP